MILALAIKFLFFQVMLLDSNETLLREYISFARELEVAEYYFGDIEVTVTDKRKYQGHQIELSDLRFQLRFANNSNLIPSVSTLPINKINVEVEYLGFYQTSTGIWGAKSILNVHSSSSWNVIEYRDVVNVDILFGRSRRLNSRQEEMWKKDFIRQVQEKLDLSLMNSVRNTPEYKFVRTYGYVPITNDLKNEELYKLALFDSFKRGVLEAWGYNIQSITSVTDLADVTDITTVFGDGIVLSYRVLDEYSRKTIDDFYCIMVEMIIKR